MKKVIILILLIISLFTFRNVRAEELNIKNGWITENNYTYYYNNDVKKIGTVSIDNKYYFFNDQGQLQYGVTDGTYYYGKLSGTRQYNYLWDENGDGIYDKYFGEDGVIVKNKWLDIERDGKNDYYFGNDFNAVNGIQEIEGIYYYFKNNIKQYAQTDGTYYYGRLSGTRQKNYWWDQDGDGKNDYYFGSDYKIVDGVQKIDGNYYYFKSNIKQYAQTDGVYYYGRLSGTRQYNYLWDENGDGIYEKYFGADGTKIKNKWIDINNDGKNDYYFGNDFNAVDGVQEVDGIYYYFKNNKKQYAQTDGVYYYGRLSGTRQKNYWWDQDGDGKNEYYFGSDYKIVDGIQKIEGNYYYFKNNKKQYAQTDGVYYYGRLSGTRQKNYWWDQDGDGNNEYYFGSDYKIVDGVQKIDGKYYYFKSNIKQYAQTDGTYYYGRLSGTRQYNYLWDQDGDGIYDKYFGEDGVIVKNKWLDIERDGKNDYYFGNDFNAVDGVQEIEGRYYYFKNNIKQYAQTDGTYYYGRLSGTRQYNYLWDENGDGIYEKYFGADGTKIKNNWIDINNDGKNDYYFGNDFNAVDGVQEIEGTYYYFKNNIKQYAQTDGTYYYGRLSGTRQSNYWWDQNGDGKNDYYFGSDYKMVYGYQTIDGKEYSFGEDGVLQYGVFRVINGKTYYYGRSSGTKISGWLNHDNTIYYFNPSNYEMVTGETSIDGNSYRFGNDGILENGWQTISGKTYYFYADGSRAKYIQKIAGIRYEFSSNGELQHSNIKIIVDISTHQGTIDWNRLWNSGEIDGVILRISAGAGANDEDSMLSYNIKEVQRLGIPYGIYIYSYAENYNEGVIFANYTNSIIKKYGMNPTIGTFLDLESNNVTKYMGVNEYTSVVNGYMSIIPTAQIYTYTDYQNTALNSEYIKSYITWIANYAVTDCPGNYRGWQYTSKGTMPGITGTVDINIFYY